MGSFEYNERTREGFDAELQPEWPPPSGRARRGRAAGATNRAADGRPSTRLEAGLQVANGRDDTLVPFARALQARQLLEANGFGVTFAPHEGGHGLEPELLASLADFL